MSRRSTQPQVTNSDTSLNFGDTRVTGSDIRLLSNDAWISLKLVAFYFEYLNSRVFTSYQCTVCISPEIAGLILITPPKELDVFLEPLEIQQKDLIIFPILDNSESEDRAHWSLLVFSKWDNAIFHFDSQAGHNANQASLMAEKLRAYFNTPSSVTVQEVDCIQQKRLQDSGPHMLANAEQVISYAVKARTVNNCPKITEKLVQSFRQKMIRLIWNLKHSSSIYQIRSKLVSSGHPSWKT
ncbi:hypothetical protein WA026_001990 [Henosepilachna vigintioctopunctata]|uniref:Ubiquitin-like protease family profile domain-containing protein n=1 Tax=Henosepilachna vigintioctopunctata TaxID=420089 RepID=A0AAW1UMS5_9CUCU